MHYNLNYFLGKKINNTVFKIFILIFNCYLIIILFYLNYDTCVDINLYNLQVNINKLWFLIFILDLLHNVCKVLENISWSCCITYWKNHKNINWHNIIVLQM